MRFCPSLVYIISDGKHDTGAYTKWSPRGCILEFFQLGGFKRAGTACGKWVKNITLKLRPETQATCEECKRIIRRLDFEDAEED